MGVTSLPRRCASDLDTFIIAVFCKIDNAMKELLGGQRLRQRGPAPTLADSEVLTMEAVSVILGLSQDQAIFRHFRRHYAHFVPALNSVHRITLVRQAANLWIVKQRLWRHTLNSISYDTLGDNPVCITLTRGA